MISRLLLLFLMHIVLAQGKIDSLSIASQVEYHIFHYQFNDALSVLETNRNVMNDEKHAVYKSFVYFYRYFVDQPSKRENRFLDSISISLENTIKNEENIIKSNEYEKILMLGGAFGFYGMAEYLRKERFSALKNADHAKEILEMLIEKDPKQSDALFGIGMYNHALSKPPGVIKFILSILGYSGDYELGTKQLFETSKTGVDTKIQAILYLINHAIFEDEHYEKIDTVFNLIPDYLKNTPMLLYKKIFFDLALGREDSLVKHFDLLLAFKLPSYIKNRARLCLARSKIKSGKLDEAYSELKTLESSEDRFIGGMDYELKESFADYYVEKKMYREAAKLYVFILDNSKVDKRIDRVEVKYEKIEDNL
jgi:tetratricopeptide (TPR) repeat protein